MQRRSSEDSLTETEASEPLPPADVIEDIRTGDYLLDVGGESARIQRGARSLQGKLNRALTQLSEDLYSKKTHFVLELIQNADDNDYVPGSDPSLTFAIAPDRLSLRNNELGFSEANVRALCDVGKSSKEKRKGYIGEKGIGFKAVFTVSNTPEIHSNGYHFRFDRSDEKYLLGFIVPIWCEQRADTPEGFTTISLPAKPGVTFSEDMLEELDARLLLFLSKLRELTVETARGNSVFRRRELTNGLTRLETLRSQAGAKAKASAVDFLRVPLAVNMEDIDDDKRPGFPSSDVILAFPVDGKGAAAPEPTSQVSAFLPIRRFGFRFPIQADFILSSSREDIHSDRPWNQALRDAIAPAFQACIPHFREAGRLGFTYLDFLPRESEIHNEFFKPVVAETIRLLRDTECLPTAGGTWGRPSQVRYGCKAFEDLIPSSTARTLLGFDYLDPRVTADRTILQQLGTKPLGPAEWVSLFRQHGDWVQQQSAEWRAKLLAALAAQDHVALAAAGLAGAACVPTEGGGLVAPSAATVFFPLSRGRKYGFEAELCLVDDALLSASTQLEPRVSELLQALGVQRDDPYQVVQRHILPRHRAHDWNQSTQKALVGHTRYVKEKLQGYLEGAARAGVTAAAAIAPMKEHLWIGTKDRKDSWTFSHVSTLYLAKEYRPAFALENLLGDAVDLDDIVSADYLQTKAADEASEAASWHEFFVKLGVRTAPALHLGSDGDWLCSPELARLLAAPDARVRKSTLEWLDAHWSQYTQRLQYVAKVGRSSVWKDSSFKSALAAMVAPIRRRKEGIPIADSFHYTTEIKDLFGEKLPYVDAHLNAVELLDTCGITHRVNAAACIKRLRQLKVEGSDRVGPIYRKLETLWAKEQHGIRQAFGVEPLIRVKGEWRRADGVGWSATGSAYLDGLYPPLQPLYRDFYGFFHEKLGVRDVPTGKRVQALRRLDQIENAAARAEEALRIYSRASADLGPRFGKQTASAPDWMPIFEREAVFVNHRDELVGKDASLFVNDDPALGELFVDADAVSLLAVPFDELSRVNRLLETLQVPRLSEAAVITVAEAPNPTERNDLTQGARRAVPLLARLMFAREPSSFEDARERLEALCAVSVLEVSTLVRRVTVGDAERFALADAAIDDGQILIRAGSHPARLLVATQLCAAANAPDVLVDAVYALLMTGNDAEADAYLLARKIPGLPASVFTVAPSPKAADEDAPGEGAPSQHDSAAPVDGVQRSPLSNRPPSPGGATPAPPRQPVAAATTANPPSPLNPIGAWPSLGSPDPARVLLELAAGAGESAAAESAAAESVEDRADRSVVDHESDAVEPPARATAPRRSRMISYAEPSKPGEPASDASREQAAAKDATGRAAVAHLMEHRPSRWVSFEEMPHFNPGFDIRAVTSDGTEELIEVKGLSAAWGADGVALTPRELVTAHQAGDRYWLAVVEFAHDDSLRAVHFVQNPFGRTDQFRFDYGWLSTASSPEAPEQHAATELSEPLRDVTDKR